MQRPKRRFSPHDKEEIVKGVQDARTIKEGLAKYGISIPTYYKWKHELFAAPLKESASPDEHLQPDAPPAQTEPVGKAGPREEKVPEIAPAILKPAAPLEPDKEKWLSNKRRLSLHDKGEVVKGVQNARTIKEGLAKYQISIPTYYKWKHELSAAPLEEPASPKEHLQTDAPPVTAETVQEKIPADIEPTASLEPDKEKWLSKKRRLSLHDKGEVVKGVQNARTIKEGLAKYQISIPTYYKWKHELSVAPLEEPASPEEPLLQTAPPVTAETVGVARTPAETVQEKKPVAVETAASVEKAKTPAKKRWYIYLSLVLLCLFIIALFVYPPQEKPFEEKTVWEFPDAKPQGDASTVSVPGARQTKPDGVGGTQARGLISKSNEWSGDFDRMLEHRRIRVLVPTSRTFYFTDKGQERGLIGDTMRDFERYVNKKYAKKLGKRPVTVFIVPETRDMLLTGVAKGLGDIAAGDITVTEERLKTVDFVAPDDIPRVSEILLTRLKSPVIAKIDDLAGKTIHVRKSTSYFESLVNINNRLKKERKGHIKIALVPEALEDEDLMEMLNAGLFEFLVVDDRIAKLWAQVLPNIKLREDIVFRKGGKIGWAIRKGSPKLEAEILDFHMNFLMKNGVMESRLAQYHKRIKQIKDPTGTAEWKRFEQTIGLFEQYGARYKFDPLMLAAQGYQESTLNQNKRSSAGAIGIMQIMPKTGASLKVGDIKLTEPNIHAGAKYMDNLMSVYFREAKFSDQERMLFAFASYNAGPEKILKMRKLAEKRGLDPNKWFNSVELVTAERIGFQTTTYVRNIYKYYVAYTLTRKAQEDKRKVREHDLFDKKRMQRVK